MTTYTVAARDAEEGETARSTDDIDAALDWFTNAVTEVMDEESTLEMATLKVGGVVWGIIEAGGVSDGGGEAVPKLRTVRGGRA